MTDCPRLRAQIEAFCPYNEQETADRLQMLQDIDTFPVLLTRDNATAHFTASCWIVNPDRTKVLMAYHNLYQSWAWLGGHADGEEDLLAVALREAKRGIRDPGRACFPGDLLAGDPACGAACEARDTLSARTCT